MYKKASKLGLRFGTPRGPLTIEQLWDLPLIQLDALAVVLDDEHKKSTKKSFLTTSTKKDKETKLKFDIVLDILKTKVEENDKLKNAKEVKEHNQKILEIIKRKEDGETEEKSIDELKAMLKA